MSDAASPKSFEWLSAPLRSIDSPGVAGSLQAESQVFYLTLFDARSVGRISDLLAARLRKAGVAESRMREAMAILSDAVSSRNPQSGVSLEIGLDVDAMAIGCSWSPGAEGLSAFFEDTSPKGALLSLVNRLRHAADGVLLKVFPEKAAVELVALIRNPDGASEVREGELIVSVIPAGGVERPEVAFYQELGDEDLAGFSLPEASSRGERKAAAGMKVKKLGSSRASDEGDSVEVEVEVEADESAVEESFGENLGFDASKPEKTRRVRSPGTGESDREVSVVGDTSVPAKESEIDTVVREREHDTDESGGPKSDSQGGVHSPVDAGPDVTTLAASAVENARAQDSDAAAAPSRTPESAAQEDQIAVLKGRLAALEREKATWQARALGTETFKKDEKSEVRLEAEFEDLFDDHETVVKGARRKGGGGETAAAEIADGTELEAEAKTVVKSRNAAQGDSATTVGDGSSETGEDQQKTVVKEKSRKKQGFFGRLLSLGSDRSEKDESSDDSRTLVRGGRKGGAEAPITVKDSGSSVSGEEITRIAASGGDGDPGATGVSTVAGGAPVVDQRGKRVAEGMMAEVLAEKARLAEATREIERSFKQKEVDYRRKLDTALREVQSREDELRNRDAVISKLREEASNAIKAAERMKAEVESTSIESGFKQKYQMSERVVQTLRADNSKLQRQIDEMRAQQLAAGQSAKTKEKDGAEALQLRDQLNRSQKQFEDLRRTNQQLLEKLNKQSGGPSPAMLEEMRRKVDASVRVAAAHRKDAETLRAKMEVMRKEEARLRVELGRIQAEFKRRGGGAAAAPASDGKAAGDSAQTQGSPASVPKSATPGSGKKVA